MYNVYKKILFYFDFWLNDLFFILIEVGKGSIDVVIFDFYGRKDIIRFSIFFVFGKEGIYLVEYIVMEQGFYFINIMFVGQQIFKSFYGVNVFLGKRYC